MSFAKRLAGVSVAVAALALAGAGAASAGTIDHTDVDAVNNGYVHSTNSLVNVPVDLDVEDVAVAVAGGAVGELGNAVVGLLSNQGAVSD